MTSERAKTSPEALRRHADIIAKHDDPDTATALRWAADDIERLRGALEECAKVCYLDEYELEFKPTKEALIARQALA